ncbi:MFS transporter [Halalkalicoccus subterraneus]|uniref:MFS transporter n=1 Tax=Halalkalicoccus subterraneus TaxID=2675002 RepID=UPI000EFB67B7|nr:MFS transporter [Halalkalicoccus subterraneus]
MTRSRLFVSLCSLAFLVNLVRVVYAPLVEPLQAAFSVGPGTIGLVVTLVWTGSALPRIPIGYLLTIVPRHRVVLLAGATLTISSLLATFANSVLTLALGAFLIGTATSGYFVAANPLISELYTGQIGRMIGIHGAVIQVAAVIAAPLVTLALLVSWRLVFALIALGALVATLVLYRIAKRTDLPVASGVDRDFLGAIRGEWRLIALGVVVFGATSFVWQGVFNFYPSYMETARGFDPGLSRNLLTVAFAAGVPAFWVSGSLVDRLPTLPYLLAVIGSFIVCVLLLTVTNGLHGIVVLSAILGYAIHSMFPAADTFLLSSFPDEHRGGAYATFSGGMMFGQALGSWFVGALVEYGIPYDTVFQGLALGLVVPITAVTVLGATNRLPAAIDA